MLQNKQYLIISQSGRALAVSAKRAAITTHVIDEFGDEDTRINCCSLRTIKDYYRNDKRLLEYVVAYIKQYPYLQAVLGSGFENRPRLLEKLQDILPVIGNGADTVARVTDPRNFFGLLDALDITHPTISLKLPSAKQQTHWLIKQAGGNGGSHIRPYERGSIPKNCYLQAFIKGQSYSVNFLANGSAFELIGFNKIWSLSVDNNNFIYAGALSNPCLSSEIQSQIRDAIAKLVPALKLRGLCGLDFMVDDDGRYYVLEINSRPTASFELHDSGNGLFRKHLAACRGILDIAIDPMQGCGGYGIVYAKKNILISRTDWPAWVADRPVSGTKIVQGMPICSVFSVGNTPKIALRQLKARLMSQSLQF